MSYLFSAGFNIHVFLLLLIPPDIKCACIPSFGKGTTITIKHRQRRDVYQHTHIEKVIHELPLNV